MFTWAVVQQEQRSRDLLLSEFAVAVLTEYSGTYPEMALSGAADGGWRWEISETVVIPDQARVLQSQISYIQLTARVWRNVAPDQTVEVTSLFARRVQP
jgi:hypothetical protein